MPLIAGSDRWSESGREGSAPACNSVRVIEMLRRKTASCKSVHCTPLGPCSLVGCDSE